MFYIDYWQESVELAETESPGSLWVCLALHPSLSDAMILWPLVQVGKVAFMFISREQCSGAEVFSQTQCFLSLRRMNSASPGASWHFEIGVRCHPRITLRISTPDQ